MKRHTEVRLYLSSDGRGSIDWFITRVDAEGQVQWQDDGSYRPGGGTPMIDGELGVALLRSSRFAASDALGWRET